MIHLLVCKSMRWNFKKDKKNPQCLKLGNGLSFKTLWRQNSEIRIQNSLFSCTYCIVKNLRKLLHLKMIKKDRLGTNVSSWQTNHTCKEPPLILQFKAKPNNPYEISYKSKIILWFLVFVFKIIYLCTEWFFMDNFLKIFGSYDWSYLKI